MNANFLIVYIFNRFSNKFETILFLNNQNILKKNFSFSKHLPRDLRQK